MRIYAENFRGFRSIDIDLDNFNFLVGDNSSGKSSILHLVDCVSKCDLFSSPKMDEDFGISEYDYFSPYFSYGDVTFAFYENKPDIFAKIITVRRRKQLSPIIISCSYIYKNTAVSYRQRLNGQQYKILRNINPADILECIEVHKQDTGYKKIDEVEGLSLGDPSILFINHSDETSNFRELRSKALNTRVLGCRLISPIRALPEKFYKYRRKIAAQGTHFASMWMDVFEFASSNEFRDINSFGKEADLFDKVSVTKISNKLPDSPLLVTVSRNGKDFMLNQVGVGVSQIVPVLIESAYSQSMDRQVLLVQQPELHLHPIAQAALGTYFFKSARNGLKAIVETHSSYFIDRFRSELRDQPNIEGGTISNDIIKIIFCTNSPEGNHAIEIGIDSQGRLVNDPEQYHDFFIAETLRTMF